MNAIVPGVGALGPYFDRYVPRRSEKCGAQERLEREIGGLRSWFVGRVWGLDAFWPDVTPGRWPNAKRSGWLQ